MLPHRPLIQTPSECDRVVGVIGRCVGGRGSEIGEKWKGWVKYDGREWLGKVEWVKWEGQRDGAEDNAWDRALCGANICPGSLLNRPRKVQQRHRTNILPQINQERSIGRIATDLSHQSILPFHLRWQQYHAKMNFPEIGATGVTLTSLQGIQGYFLIFVPSFLRWKIFCGTTFVLSWILTFC